MLVQIINRPFILFEHESLFRFVFFSSLREIRESRVFVTNTSIKKNCFFSFDFCFLFISRSFWCSIRSVICRLALILLCFFSVCLFHWMEKNWILFFRLSWMCYIYTHRESSIQFDSNLKLPFDASLAVCDCFSRIDIDCESCSIDPFEKKPKNDLCV